MRKTLMMLGAFALLLTACQSASSAEEVVLAAAEPWNTGDVEAAMDFYNDDTVVKFEPAAFSTLTGAPSQYSGMAELRAWFEELKEMNFTIEVDVVAVDGNTVTTETRTWVDATRDLGVAPLVATEVYAVEDGKITGWTWTLSESSFEQVQMAIQALAPPASEPEAIDVSVVFDGETCSYDGPTEVVLGTVLSITFDDSAYPGAMVIGHVRDGTTQEEFISYIESTPGGSPPPYAGDANPGIRIGAGPLEVVLDQAGAYTLSCGTSPQDTNEQFAGAWIEVAEE
jgi:hypothetical protein